MAKRNHMPANLGGLTVAEEKIVYRAMCLLEKALLREDAPIMKSTTAARTYLRMRIGMLEREEFHVMWLDNSHRLIASECLFTGTIDAAAVYPREVAKGALQMNAAAVIVAHNHPSGSIEPSEADRMMTRRLKDALDLVGVRLLDHFIITTARAVSFADNGWL